MTEQQQQSTLNFIAATACIGSVLLGGLWVLELLMEKRKGRNIP